MLRRVRWGIAATAAVGVVAIAPATEAAPLPASSAPLAGSTFTGGDGDQDDLAPHIDWQGLLAGGRVTHSPDPSAQDTAFTGGAKEDEPGKWDVTTEDRGVSPGKANIIDAWSSVDQPGADTFLYLAFAREDARGDTFVAFELNRDPRLWDNGRAMIPCRRTGDVLVVFAAHGNGIDVHLEQWTTSAADLTTGCARQGALRQVSSIPTGGAQGAVNSGAIAIHLPGEYGPTNPISETGLFGEAALNIGKLVEAAFQNRCLAFSSIWMHSRSSESESSQMQDIVAPRPLALRTCSASGVKFFDLDADGRRDPGEPGIPRFAIWADYDGDGRRDASEPFTVTDRRGRYVLSDIRPPSGIYTLRETLLTEPPATLWRCSYPKVDTAGGFGNGPGGLFACGWGPISTVTTPYARDKDFGNWLPAWLRLTKRLWPSDDPGRFDLTVNGQTVLAAAGDGSTITIPVPPGTYDVAEVAVPPTDKADYRSGVRCRASTRRPGVPREGTSYTGLELRSGDHATCTFANVRPGSPAIAIEKRGPAVATAGDALHYILDVTNPGDRPLPAASVRVSDPSCDDPPVLTGKADTAGDDDTPGTLDPGDSWTHECTRTTPEPTGDCALTTVTNTATATSPPLSAGDSTTTTLRCPLKPVEPTLPPVLPPTSPEPPTTTVPSLPAPAPTPGPPAPAPVTPPGPEPPSAGTPGRARLALTAPGGCLSHASQLRLDAERVSQIRVDVDGRHLRTETLEILQQRATPLNRLFAPGPHRIVIRVTFERGSGTRPLTLARTVVVCAIAARRPHVTG